jgi:phosphoribosylaminoimidazole-succinocarboxamide synthase
MVARSPAVGPLSAVSAAAQCTMNHLHSCLFESNLTSLPLITRGKVRDIYEVDDKHMLIVASDRISAFDVVLPDPIPGKGIVLTAISNFWFHALESLIGNHLTGIDPVMVVDSDDDRETVKDRSVVVRRMRPLPIEAVVRGFLIGSGWKDYCATGSVSGVTLPERLELGEELPEPIFTPSTKALPGNHDQNITEQETEKLIGADLTRQVKQISLQLYAAATKRAHSAGILIADTKFEFGLGADDRLVLIDELLTPDSSRFWPADRYRPGISPPSYDKQYVRDFLETLDWDKRPPAPTLPEVVIERTREKYYEAMALLTGARLD